LSKTIAHHTLPRTGDLVRVRCGQSEGKPQYGLGYVEAIDRMYAIIAYDWPGMAYPVMATVPIEELAGWVEVVRRVRR